MIIYPCSFVEGVQAQANTFTITVPAWITEDPGPPIHPSILQAHPSFFPKGWCGVAVSTEHILRYGGFCVPSFCRNRVPSLCAQQLKGGFRVFFIQMRTCTTNAAFFLLLLPLCACCVATGLACDPNGGGAKFGYIGSIGPAHWGSLSPNFTQCARGTHQSPIDISTAEAALNPGLQPLHRDYTVANATLVDNVFNIALRFDDDGAAGSVRIDGKVYRLKQMHWHSPSEHTINGQRFPVELHMVHASDDGNVTVVAMLYRFGSRPDPLLWQIQDKLAALYAEEGAPVPAGNVSLWSLRLYSHTYYHYVGSFTTPPCTENVIWSVLAQVREMTVDQAAALMAPLEQAYRRNNRPTQPMNGRIVQVYYHRFMNKKTAP
ncbi:alpha carbonic anhydrase 1, chloroplastic-like isoform X1 [Miscanthus floridulus]|uniref:alpha carbonic anhydrase 1, chloroplastic-like isoform X1 n=1 Tax=Miscanthus floridulus TaxID=154761 RepID=UPI003459D338